MGIGPTDDDGEEFYIPPAPTLPQDLRTSADVTFNSVSTGRVDQFEAATLVIGDTLATSIDIGKSGVATRALGGLSADIISEVTPAAGVTIDGVICKDSNVSASSGFNISGTPVVRYGNSTTNLFNAVSHTSPFQLNLWGINVGSVLGAGCGRSLYAGQSVLNAALNGNLNRNVLLGWNVCNTTTSFSGACTIVGCDIAPNASGNRTTIFGYGVGTSLTTGARNVLIGGLVDCSAGTSDATVVGDQATASVNSVLVLGSLANDTTNSLTAGSVQLQQPTVAGAATVWFRTQKLMAESLIGGGTSSVVVDNNGSYDRISSGIVTQTTSNSTAVTLNTLTGVITMFEALPSGAATSFVFNNSYLTGSATVVCSTTGYSSVGIIPTTVSMHFTGVSGQWVVVVYNSDTSVTANPVDIHFRIEKS
jgi:hypothetical protein